MAQHIVSLNRNGIVLAADSKAFDFATDESMQAVSVNPLIRLSDSTAILAGGDAESADICGTFRQFVANEELRGVSEIYSAALPFLGTEYEKSMRHKCDCIPVDPVHHMFFILAGHDPEDQNEPFKAFLIWTKKKLPQLDGDTIASAFSVPRRMGLEYTLSQMNKNNESLDTVLATVKKRLEGLPVDEDSEIGPPYHYALITEKGFQEA
jgi:hypothetical protein